MPPKLDKSEKATNDDLLKELKEVNAKLSLLTVKLHDIHCFVRGYIEEGKEDRNSEVSKNLEQICKTLETAKC